MCLHRLLLLFFTEAISKTEEKEEGEGGGGMGNKQAITNFPPPFLSHSFIQKAWEKRQLLRDLRNCETERKKLNCSYMLL